MMRALRLITTLLLLTGTVFAAEIAELRNGFTIRHRTRGDARRISAPLHGRAEEELRRCARQEVESYSSEPDPSSQPTPATPCQKHQPDRQRSLGKARRGLRLHPQRHQAGERRQRPRGFPRRSARPDAVDARARPRNSACMTASAPSKTSTAARDICANCWSATTETPSRPWPPTTPVPARWIAINGVPPYRETRQYVQRVVREYNKSKSAGKSAEPSNEKSQTAAASRGNATTAE